MIAISGSISVVPALLSVEESTGFSAARIDAGQSPPAGG